MSQPRYRVLSKSFIDGDLLEAGTEIVYLGMPGSQLEPLNDAAKITKDRSVQNVDDASDDPTAMSMCSATRAKKKR